MKLENETELREAAPDEAVAEETPVEIPVERPLPDGLRYFMVGLLVVGVVGVVAFGYIRLAGVKAPAPNTTDSCKDPVTENRLRETLKQSPNDFATLMDWGSYNMNCDKNFAAAVAAYQRAVFLTDQANSSIKPEERAEANFRLGLAYLYNSNMKEAQDRFEMLVNENPQNTSALLALAAVLAKENPDRAATYLQKIIEIAPGSEVANEAQSLLEDLKKKPTVK